MAIRVSHYLDEVSIVALSLASSPPLFSFSVSSHTALSVVSWPLPLSPTTSFTFSATPRSGRETIHRPSPPSPPRDLSPPSSCSRPLSPRSLPSSRALSTSSTHTTPTPPRHLARCAPGRTRASDPEHHRCDSTFARTHATATRSSPSTPRGAAREAQERGGSGQGYRQGARAAGRQARRRSTKPAGGDPSAARAAARPPAGTPSAPEHRHPAGAAAVPAPRPRLALHGDRTGEVGGAERGERRATGAESGLKGDARRSAGREKTRERGREPAGRGERRESETAGGDGKHREGARE
ncbi:uncharacterized protein LOC109712234 [Ananas comosus]|uniref:Uncharacterized protein LOC109712234 n=1 Tax=Ananas comosus TaxID=4615 RepID=A0A6P5F5P8_ANACO|nr:uncharacterized protein LOC109712234 [Ananas comosus]